MQTTIYVHIDSEPRTNVIVRPYADGNDVCIDLGHSLNLVMTKGQLQDFINILAIAEKDIARCEEAEEKFVRVEGHI